ncbi:MAG: alginate O-acetyltransferase complex protein AlgI [Halieaceae bacterium]|jgi:alginate O-acetyltransferase complex protein AlgI
MLFNSYEFLFAFLPCVLFLYFAFNRHSIVSLGKITLVAFSWFFYAWWNPIYLPLLIGSIAANYSLSRLITACDKTQQKRRKRLMLTAVFLNIGGLAYFKYMDFFIANLNWLGTDIPLLHLALPLAISFFSLQQIAYIVDTYRGIDCRGSFLDYCIFVSFFPQLIAGPIVHHREIIPQLRAEENRYLNYGNLSLGCFLFAIGLFKKVALADTFAIWASNGFDIAQQLSLVEAWIVSYSYTFQLYFDFSGYSDMALGLALMFNIKLPQNFNSPYAATSIINLWQRWHMTLTRFINMYIFRPLLRALPRVNFGYGMVASFTAMMVAGVWHGAAWTFVAFGALQGVAIVGNHIWRRLKIPMPAWLGWFLTFHFFSLSLVIFRATQWDDAVKVYRGLLGMSGVEPWASFTKLYQGQPFWFFSYADNLAEKNMLATITCATLIGFFIYHVARLPNSNTLADRFTTNGKYLGATVVMLLTAIMMLSNPSEFIYFQF